MTEIEEIDEFDATVRIVQSVLRQTREKKLTWSERGPGREDAFESDLPSGNLEIGTLDNDGVAPHDFRIYGVGSDGNIRLVYSLDGRNRADQQPMLAELWGVVERQVRGVDEVLRNLLNDLGQD